MFNGGSYSRCKTMEDMITDFITSEKKIAAIRILKRGKMTCEEIAEDLELALEVVEDLLKNILMYQ